MILGVDFTTFRFAVPWLLMLLAIVPVLIALSVLRKRSAQTPRLRYANTNLILAPTRSWRLFFRPTLFSMRLLALILVLVLFPWLVLLDVQEGVVAASAA